MKTMLICIIVLVLVFVVGCATSRISSEKTNVDGTTIKYKAVINSFGQDFSGSDLSASLNPEGKTTVKAGAIDNTTSQVTADVAASMVELIKAMLPYIATAPVAPQ